MERKPKNLCGIQETNALVKGTSSSKGDEIWEYVSSPEGIVP